VSLRPVGKSLVTESIYLGCRSHWFCRQLERCSVIVMAALTSCRAGKCAELRLARDLKFSLIRVVL